MNDFADTLVLLCRRQLKCFQVATEDHRQKPLLVTAGFLSRLDSPMAMMLALDKALEHPLLLKPDKVRDGVIRPSSVRRRLPSIQVWYLELLAEWTRIVHSPRFLDELAVQRLFGFRPAEEDATYLGELQRSTRLPESDGTD